jgi:hypothetical protein
MPRPLLPPRPGDYVWRTWDFDPEKHGDRSMEIVPLGADTIPVPSDATTDTNTNDYGYGIPVPSPAPDAAVSSPEDDRPPRIAAVPPHRNDREIAEEVYSTMLRNDAAKESEPPPMSGGSGRPVGIRISTYEGAGPFGHIGIGIDNGVGAESGTMGYYPSNGSAVGPGIVQPDDPAKRIDSMTIPATPEQIERVTQCINQHSKNPGEYKFSYNDCRHFVAECLRRSGVTNLPVHGTPQNMIDSQRSQKRRRLEDMDSP